MVATSVLLTLASSLDAAPQISSTILGTKHNLSVSGPGEFKSAQESRVCIFCHAPHNSRTQVPLWNRQDSTASYLTYTSSTLVGDVGQPNGSTKLCLSCHDGTIALGSVVSLQTEIPMVSGRRLLNSGPGFFGANLRDDHPVSFHYQSSRGGSGIGYRSAPQIVKPITLDSTGYVQCTSCHDSHSNVHGSFLRQDNKHSQLCLACHANEDWSASSHSTSTATWNQLGLNPWPSAKYTNVAENACANCHRTHGAGRPQRLLNFLAEEDNCLRCHNGNVAAKDVGADLNKSWAHPTLSSLGLHDPIENPLAMPRHAECEDCHNPHAARSGSVPPPGVPGPIFGVSGLSNSGQVIPRINNGYELCYKCHADSPGSTLHVPRVIQQANLRVKFNIQNPSFHPIEGPGRSSDVPSLISPWTTSSVMACTDCHQSNDSPDFGGAGAKGPHGSIYKPLLGARYDLIDGREESPSLYALCYKCHSRASLLNDVTFEYHKKHIKKFACFVCHDPHGVSSNQGTVTNNSRLINFDRTIVTPFNSVLEFVDTGFRRGECTLMCHGKKHDRKDYGK